MKKIAFWSNVHGQCGSTSNMIAISVVTTLMQQQKNALLQSHFDLNNLEEPLLGRKIRDMNDFHDMGVDALVREIKSNPCTEDAVLNASFSLLNQKLNLFPATTKTSREIYENDTKSIFCRIVDDIAKFHDNVFIDICSGMGELSKAILENADIIVVNLSQNKKTIEDFFIQYQFSKPIFYLIGNYNHNSKYNLKNLIRIHKAMTIKNTATIPYNVEYQDSISDGEALRFLQKNIECKSDDSNYYFISSLKKAVKLMQELGV